MAGAGAGHATTGPGHAVRPCRLQWRRWPVSRRPTTAHASPRPSPSPTRLLRAAMDGHDPLPNARRADRLGRLLADDGGRALLFALTDEVLRTPAAGAGDGASCASSSGAASPRSLPPLDRLGLARSAALGSRRGAASRRGDRAPAHPGRDARRDRRRRRSGVRPLRAAPARRRLRPQRQPARRGDPRRRRGGRPRCGAVASPHRAPRRRLRVGEDLGALRRPRRARLRPRAGAHRRPPPRRLRRGRGQRPAGVREPRHGGVPRPPPDRRRVHDRARRAAVPRPARRDRPAGVPARHPRRARRAPRVGRRAPRAPAGRRSRSASSRAPTWRWSTSTPSSAAGTPAPYATKAEVDASYKALLDRLLDAAADGGLHVGVASHNLFDVAWALGRDPPPRRSTDRVEIEMLEGMAPPQARATRDEAGALLLYAPVVTDEDFAASIAYLVAPARREQPARRTSCARCSRSRPARRRGTHERRRFEQSVADRAERPPHAAPDAGPHVPSSARSIPTRRSPTSPTPTSRRPSTGRGSPPTSRDDRPAEPPPLLTTPAGIDDVVAPRPARRGERGRRRRRPSAAPRCAASPRRWPRAAAGRSP